MRVAAHVFSFLLLIMLAACSGGPSFVASESQPAEGTTPTTEAVPPTPTVEAIPPTATSPASATTSELSLVDTSGVTVTFAKRPERIIVLGVRDLEILAALGIEPVAVAPYSFLEKLIQNPLYFKQPNDIKVLQAAEGDLGVDLEEIAALKPDLVFGWEEVRTGLTDIAPVYDAYNQQDTYQDSFEELRKFAGLFGREAQAEAAIKGFEDRLAAYKKLSPRNVSVMYVGGTTQEVYIRHGRSGTCHLFNEVARCDWEDPAQDGFWSYTASLETLLQLDPDVLLLESWDEKLSTDELIAEYEQNPLLAELKAVKNGRLIPIESDAKDLDGMGIIGATRQLDTYMPILYPDIFPQALTDEQVQELVEQ